MNEPILDTTPIFEANTNFEIPNQEFDLEGSSDDFVLNTDFYSESSSDSDD